MNTFRDHYALLPYTPGEHFFGDAIVVDEQGLWHVTTPLGALSPRAFALSSGPTDQEREAQVLAAYPQLRGDPHHDSQARR